MPLHSAVFEVEKVLIFNRIGTIAWFLNGRLLRRRTFSLLQIKLLNVIVPLIRVLEWIPIAALSLVAVFKRAEGRRGPDMLALVWLTAMVLAGGGALQNGLAYLRAIEGGRPRMCVGLRHYSVALDALKGVKYATFVAADPSQPRNVERYFCAQYALAPVAFAFHEGVDAELVRLLANGPILVDTGAVGGRDFDASRIAPALDLLRREATAVELPSGLILFSKASAR